MTLGTALNDAYLSSRSLYEEMVKANIDHSVEHKVNPNRVTDIFANFDGLVEAMETLRTELARAST